MKRRSFLKRTAGAGAALFTAASFPAIITSSKTFAQTEAKPYDLVAVKGGAPDAMFDAAMESMGGISKYVKPNQTVVVKPNIGWDVEPERAANTNPALVGRIVKACMDAGAKEVYVFDHTCDDWRACYSNSGIEAAAKNAGATIVPGNSESYYGDVEVPWAKKIPEASVHELIAESDVFINVPILKSHGGARLTMAMKNLMGIVWDRGFWHSHDLHRCIAEFPAYRKPDLNIIDAYRVMKKNGPRGVSVNDVVEMKSLVMSPDIVAADAAATLMFGIPTKDVEHVELAHELGLGTKDLKSLNINRIKM